MSQTRLFVSSTCYDLIHIRQALNAHIQNLGHTPVMSEFASFHVDPRLSAIENCRSNVRNNADVFVLIIGGRRGSVDAEAGRSIVNLEYEAAVQEGLDIFVFVDQAVLNLVPIWKQNRDVSFQPTVDSNEVLQFIDRIRSEQRWTFPFVKEADIVEVLSLQLSGQLRDLLAQRRAGHLSLAEQFRGETAAALQLVQTRAPFWEYLLTAELLERRFTHWRRELNDIYAGRVLGAHRNLRDKEYFSWVTAKFQELVSTAEKLNDYRLKAGRLGLRLKVAGLRLKPPGRGCG